MTTRTSYHVVNGANAPELIDRVNTMLEQGWVCIGGVNVTKHGEYVTSLLYSQALVKEGNEDSA